MTGGVQTNALRLLRLVAYLSLTLAMIPIQSLAVWRGWGLANRLPMFYHRLVCRILGFRVRIAGQPTTARPTLFVVNHISYIDIEMLGAVIPGSFVAKAEVRQWPVFGLLARLQRSVFVDRRVRSSATQRDSLTERLSAGDNLILFPEGTSNDGTRLRPFKSALFSAAEIKVGDQPVTVQPVSLCYTGLNGMPLGRNQRPAIAWYGDMALAPHLWNLLGLGVIDVVVQFHQAVDIRTFGSRKKLSDHCEQIIGTSFAQALAGRLSPAPAE